MNLDGTIFFNYRLMQVTSLFLVEEVSLGTITLYPIKTSSIIFSIHRIPGFCKPCTNQLNIVQV